MRLLLLLALVALGASGVPVSRSTLRTARDFDAADTDLEPRDIIREWSLSHRAQPADIYYAMPGDYERHDGYLYPAAAAGSTDADADYEYYMPSMSEAAATAGDWELDMMGAQLEQEAMHADLDADAEEAAVRWGAAFTPNAYDTDADYEGTEAEMDADMAYTGNHQPRVSFKPQRLLSGTMAHSRVVPASALESGKSVSLTFPKWDPALGRLDAVSFILDATMNGEAAYSNPKRQESAVSLNAGAQLSVRSPQLVASLLHQRQAQAAAITTPATLPITRAAPTSVGARSTNMGTEFRDRSGRFEAIRAAEDARRTATQQAIVSGEVEALQKPLVIAMPIQQVQRRTRARAQARFPALEARDIQSTILSRGGTNAELKRAMLNEFTGRDFVTLVLDKETIGQATAPESSASGLSVQLAIATGANVTVVYHFTDDREPLSAARRDSAASGAATAGVPFSSSSSASMLSPAERERANERAIRQLVREMQHDPQMLLHLFPGLMSPAASPPIGSDLARSLSSSMPRTTYAAPIETQPIRARQYQYQYPMEQQPMMVRAASSRSYRMMEMPDMDIIMPRDQPMMSHSSGRARREQPQQQHISDQELERLFAQHLMSSSGAADAPRDMMAAADYGYDTEGSYEPYLYYPADSWAFAGHTRSALKDEAKDMKPKEKQDKEKEKKDKEEEEKDEREEAERVADAVMARVRAAAASVSDRVRSAFPAAASSLTSAQAERVARSVLDPATWQQQLQQQRSRV